MKDRYLVRGYSLYDKTWHSGSLIEHTLGGGAGGGMTNLQDQYYILTKDGSKYSINEETIGQCTGLKDSAGILIYEGDIIQCYGTKYEVYYDRLKCSLLLKCLESNGDKEDSPLYLIDHIYTFEDLLEFESWEELVNRTELKVVNNIYNK